MKLIAIFFFSLLTATSFAQATTQVSASDDDAFYIKNIYARALAEGRAYDWLRTLCAKAPGRLSGSAEAAAAVVLTQQIMDTLGLDTVYLQPCRVPHWVRGEKEQAKVVGSNTQGDFQLNIAALGNSVATPREGITAPIIELKNLDDVERLGGQLRGKIVFFNRPMDAAQVSTFAAYSGAVDQRVKGAAMAGRYGALAVIVRSMASRLDDFPHTGSTVYDPRVPKIPAVCVSTNDAEKLAALLKVEKEVRVFIKTNCSDLGTTTSYNVVGEIRGQKNKDEIILVGGHLDAWDLGKGAHDDGAGCVQSMHVLYALRQIGYKPNRTLRCVLFMNEENGLAGATEYAKLSNERHEFHLAAIESDAGGFTPRGFNTEGDERIFIDRMKKLTKWSPFLEPYDLVLSKGGSGADISPLKSQKGLLIGLRVDSQRYFDVHHTANDVIENVHPRELHLGAAAMTSLVYLIDKYGL